MKFKKKIPKVHQVISTCCWCGLKIKDEGPLYSIGCKKRPEVNISKYEGKVMPVKILTSGKTVLSFVPPSGSDARKAGNDFMFALCSEDCGDQLKEALETEKEIGEMILSADHIFE
ncbi:MAG: hypothetical protein PF503_16420 [Desulfobacula sp.]|jgi:hypothetical protein|nr:hypothetical protein [Desulfobacula sp.]